MKRSYVDITEGQVHYQTQGDAEPLLLLHQTSLSSEEYSEIIPILAETYRVIAMDLLGHGGSDKPPPLYKIEDHAESIIQFLDALGIMKASIVGHHVGSRIAVEVAATWPERVDKLILSGCPWYTPEERNALPSDPKYQSLEVKEDGSFLIELWETYKSRWRSDIKPKVLCKAVAISLLTLARSYDIHEAAIQHDIDPRLRLIKSPTLLVSGSEDLFCDRLDIISRLIPRCRTQVISGAGYFISLEKPIEFAETILAFLQDPQRSL